MMTTRNKLLLIGGVIAAGVVALKVGVPLGTLLIVGALLLCCAPMLFMRGNKNQGNGRKSMDQRSDEAKNSPLEEQERKPTQTKP